MGACGDCCGTATRCILAMINIPIILAGFVMLVVGGVFLVNDKLEMYPELEQYSQNVDSILIPMTILGAIFLVIGLLGCVGAITEKGWLLKPYFFLVFLIVIAQIGILIAGAVMKDEVKDTVLEAMEGIFNKYKEKYVEDEAVDIKEDEARYVNIIQKLIGCCGYEDGSTWWKTTSSTKIPPGCCSGWTYDTDFVVTADTALVDNCDNAGDLNEEGCRETASSLLNEFGVIIIAVIAAIVVLQILCLAWACCIWKRGNEKNEFA